VRETGLFTLFTIVLNLLFSERRVLFSEIFIFCYKFLSWHQNEIDAGKEFNLSFACL